MLLEYGALVIAIYAVLFGPIVGGLIWAFKQKKTWMSIVALVILAWTIFIVLHITLGIG